MLQEVGTIRHIDEEALWVETLQQSACGSCRAQKGCGQHVLGKALSTSSTLRVLRHNQPSQQYSLNQQVTLGIPEDIVVKGALIVYLTPLLMLMLCALLAYSWRPLEGVAIAGAAFGLILGGAMVRLHAYKTRNDPRLQPVILC